MPWVDERKKLRRPRRSHSHFLRSW